MRLFRGQKSLKNTLSKKEIRNKIWSKLEEKNIARFPMPVYGRIPNFIDSEIAVKKIEKLKIFKRSTVIKVNPDSPQKNLREIVLNSKKILLMLTPRLKKGFILLEPALIPEKLIKYASTIKGAVKFGRFVRLEEIPKLNLIIVGSVAVSEDGKRLGKGEGYGDIEYAIFRELGLIDDSILVVTTVHEEQIIDEMPFEEHDLPVDLIVTPDRVIKTNTKYVKPTGIFWSKIDPKKQNSIPILGELKK